MPGVDTIRNRSRLIMVVASVLLLVAATALMIHNRKTSFDARRWHSARESGDSHLLLRMCDDLKTKLLLEKPTKAQVVEMLGEPNSRQEIQFHYELGGGALSSGWFLEIYFDPNRVTYVLHHAG